MRREIFPSSRENVDRTIEVAESGEKLNKDQRKALRDYLAGGQSSNVLKTETAKRVNRIREILGYPSIPDFDKDEKNVEEALSWEETIAGQKDESREHPKKFSAVINGIEIIVNRPYADTDNNYELYLPQMTEVIGLPGGDEEAEKVFEEACRLAKEREIFPKEDRTGHAREIYKKMLEFVYDLGEESQEYS